MIDKINSILVIGSFNLWFRSGPGVIERVGPINIGLLLINHKGYAFDKLHLPFSVEYGIVSGSSETYPVVQEEKTKLKYTNSSGKQNRFVVLTGFPWNTVEIMDKLLQPESTKNRFFEFFHNLSWAPIRTSFLKTKVLTKKQRPTVLLISLYFNKNLWWAILDSNQ